MRMAQCVLDLAHKAAASAGPAPGSFKGKIIHLLGCILHVPPPACFSIPQTLALFATGARRAYSVQLAFLSGFAVFGFFNPDPKSM